jgi:DNA-directed RNA polymerase subunit L
MVVVKNIKIRDVNLVRNTTDNNNKAMQKCLKYIPLNEAKKLLPTKSKMVVSFELDKTCTSIANGIRRCLVDEMEVKSLDFNEYEDLKTDDKYILCDIIKKQICLLPIDQDTQITDYDKMEISLEKENTTDKIIAVTSDDITFKVNGKSIDKHNIIGTNVILINLRPSKFIRINKIRIVSGITKEDAGKFSNISRTEYKTLDIQPMTKTDFESTGISSMKTNPEHFYISYTTHRNIKKPLTLMVKCCDTLIGRLSNILAEMKNISNNAISYFSKLLTLESEADLKILEITGEYWTIVNLISQYCFILTKGNIKFVAPALIHSEKEIGLVKIIHKDFSTLIQSAIKEIISDFEIIKKSFTASKV